MKTKEMNEENAKVTGQNKNWQSGASSSIGAAAGVVAGSMAQSAFAAEPVVEETVQPPRTANLVAAPAASPDNEVIHATVDDTGGTSPATPPAGVILEPENTVTVVAYETVTCEDGSQMDVAGVIVNGQEVIIADVNHNGEADLMAMDLDGNGMISENEIANVQNEHIQMNDLANAAAQTNVMEDPALTADGGCGPDYTNDADVTGYMA